MAKARPPVEQRSLGGWFLLFSLVLAGLCAWTVYDETVTRRPWKQVQTEFNRLELAKVKEEITRTREALEQPAQKAKLAKLEADLKAAQKVLAGPEHQQAKARAAALAEEKDHSRQHLIFLRSERDEAFYLWKWAARDGDTEASERESTRFADLEQRIAKKEKSYAALEADLAEAQATVTEQEQEAADLTQKRDQVHADLNRLLTLRDGILLRRPRIEQILSPELAAVDRCPTCHLAVNRAGFDGPEWNNPYRTHPDRKGLFGQVHPPDRYGCTVCHDGEGPQTKGVGKRPFDHGRSDPYWERPLLEGPFIQSSCRRCHAEEWEVPLAPVLVRGKQVFADLGCYGCHLTPGFEKSRRIGPSLTRLAAKIETPWLLKWLARPRDLRPTTRMPNAWPEALEPGLGREAREKARRLRDHETKAIAAFLLSDSETATAPAPPTTAGSAEHGRVLFMERGCVACHRPAALELPPLASQASAKDYGPDLSDLGSKVKAGWIETFLANPRAAFAETRMPDPELTAADRADLAAFLMSLVLPEPPPPAPDLTDPALIEQGKTLVNYYGCMGCHEITGLDSGQKVGPELDGFGKKIPALLSFGDTVADPREQTWVKWTTLKLASPRLFRTEKIALKMPDNELGPDDVTAAAVFLHGLENEASPAFVRRLSPREAMKARGDRLLAEYNCRGCHLLDGQGGDVRSLIRDPGLYPPDLTRIGDKLQPEWMFQFLKNPTVLRPWLTIRMPRFNFTDDEDSSFVNYFMARAGREDLFVEVPAKMDPNLYDQTARVFIELKCLQCHVMGAGASGSLSDLAPDMSLARGRLRPSWMERFIRDPQSLMAGTKMPTFFPLEDDEDPDSMMTPLPRWLGGDARAQVRAIRDFLYVFSSQEELQRLAVKLKEESSGLPPQEGTTP